MASKEGEVVGTCADTDAAKVEVGRFRDIVLITAECGDGDQDRMDFGPAEFDEFIRLLFEAKRRAEAWAAQHAGVS